MFIYKCKIETHLTQWFTLFYSVPVLSSCRHLYTNRCSQTGPPPVTDEPILHLLVILSPIGKDIPSTLSKPQFCVVGKLDIGEHAENAEVCGDAWFTGVWGSSHSGLMLCPTNKIIFLLSSGPMRNKPGLFPNSRVHWATWKHPECDDRTCFG